MGLLWLISLSVFADEFGAVITPSTSYVDEALGREFRPAYNSAVDLVKSGDAKVPSEGREFTGVTLAHNVGSEAQVDKVFREALGAVATLVKMPEKVFWGGYSGYFSDLDGHLWEVAHNPYLWIGPRDDDT